MPDFAAIAQVLMQTDREVWLLSARSNGGNAGLIATFVNQASIVPELPRVVVGLAKQHHTAQAVEASRGFMLHLLTESQIDLVWRFGLHSGRDADKWAGLACDDSAFGGPRLTDALAWLDCRVEASLDIGDRTVHVAEVLAGRVERPGSPLTMRRLIQLAAPERLRELKEGLLRDAAIDATAIQAWREADGFQRSYNQSLTTETQRHRGINTEENAG
jgi:flavin reductase (DIM6/NTAB) family NADH-FMN oxidoreductase RutF